MIDYPPLFSAIIRHNEIIGGIGNVLLLSATTIVAANNKKPNIPSWRRETTKQPTGENRADGKHTTQPDN